MNSVFHRRYLTTPIVLVLSSVAWAQTPPLWQELDQDLTPRMVPPALITLAADVNGDGATDILFGFDGQNRLFLNNGSTGFQEATATHLPQIAQDTSALLFFDVDNDGDLDFAEGLTGRNELYINDGSGVFTLGFTFGVQATTTAFAAGDVDGDGYLDLATGNLTGPDSLGFNNGNGTFTSASGAQFPAFSIGTSGMQFADVDGDLDLDLLTSNRLLINDGAGTFVNASATQLPTGGSPVFVGDLDGDGDVDALMGENLQFNDGTGFFTTRSIPGMSAARLVDVDGDSDLDIVSSTLSGLVPARNLFLNNGLGRFSDRSASQMPFAAAHGGSFAVLDTFNRGTNDVVFATGEIYFNDRAGTFSVDLQPSLPGFDDTINHVATGDLDGDGAVDLFVSNQQIDRVWLQDGTGRFDDVTGAVPGGQAAGSVRSVLVDVDGDGDLDAVTLIGQAPSRPRLLVNDGAGRFTDRTLSSMPSLMGFQTDLAAGDVDGDLDSDLLVSMRPSFFGGPTSVVLTNDGSGNFTAATLRPMSMEASVAAVLRDFDGDGDLDAFIGNGRRFSSQQNRLYRNDGVGGFTDVSLTALPLGTNRTTSAVAADIDGDGDVDLVLGQNESGEAIRILTNDGSGTFTVRPGTPAITTGEPRVFVADLDGDGDADVFMQSIFSPRANAVLRNDGQGNFIDASSLIPTLNTKLVWLFADLDMDRDADLVVSVRDEGPQLLANLTRQVHIPLRPRVGGVLRYRVQSAASSPAFLIVALAERTAPMPVPPVQGMLRVDTILWVPPVLSPNPATTLDVPLPNDPNFRGVEFFGQAVFLDGPFLRDWNFSGLARARTL